MFMCWTSLPEFRADGDWGWRIRTARRPGMPRLPGRRLEVHVEEGVDPGQALGDRAAVAGSVLLQLLTARSSETGAGLHEDELQLVATCGGRRDHCGHGCSRALVTLPRIADR